MKSAIVFFGILAVATAAGPTAQEFLDGANYTLDEILAGSPDFSGHNINGHDGLVLRDSDNILGGFPDRIVALLLETVQRNANTVVVDDNTTPGFYDLLCYWTVWTNQQRIINNRLTALLNGTACGDLEKPIANRLVQTSKGEHISIEYAAQLGCLLDNGNQVPIAMRNAVTDNRFGGSLPCDTIYISNAGSE